jgi:hypothetical protein
MSNTPLAVKAKNFFAAIELERILEKICFVFAVIGEIAVSVIMGAAKFFHWLIVSAATAAVWAAVWFVVWAIGLAVTVNLFVNYSGFKFTKLMEWLS